eukprot:scaffold103880_cov54-Cyclotella_meneghiniana.AAC.1
MGGGKNNAETFGNFPFASVHCAPAVSRLNYGNVLDRSWSPSQNENKVLEDLTEKQREVKNSVVIIRALRNENESDACFLSIECEEVRRGGDLSRDKETRTHSCWSEDEVTVHSSQVHLSPSVHLRLP